MAESGARFPTRISVSRNFSWLCQEKKEVIFFIGGHQFFKRLLRAVLQTISQNIGALW